MTPPQLVKQNAAYLAEEKRADMIQTATTFISEQIYFDIRCWTSCQRQFKIDKNFGLAKSNSTSRSSHTPTLTKIMSIQTGGAKWIVSSFHNC